MKSKKLKPLLILLLLLPLSITILGTGCEKDEITSSKSRFIGKWVEQESFTDGICDTIIFKEDNTIELYIPIQEWTYSFPSSNTIEFVNPSSLLSRKCHFIFNRKNELTIFNFYDRTITLEIKDITFERIN